MNRLALITLALIIGSTAYAQKIENKSYRFKITAAQNQVTREKDNTYIQVVLHPKWKEITFFSKKGDEEDYLITDVFGEYGKDQISYEMTNGDGKRAYFTLYMDDRGGYSGGFKKNDVTITFNLRER